MKAGTFSDYTAEMDKAIAEGQVRILTEAEMSAWHSPVHYISTFAVVKPDSLSTWTRIVSNSAMKNSKSKLVPQRLHVGLSSHYNTFQPFFHVKTTWFLAVSWRGGGGAGGAGG